MIHYQGEVCFLFCILRIFLPKWSTDHVTMSIPIIIPLERKKLHKLKS